MNANEEIGIKTPATEKKRMDTENELRAKQVDVDFFSSAISFTGVEPISANNLLGAGTWKKYVKETFGEQAMQQAEKYGNKPIDFKLAGIKVPAEFSRFFSVNDQVQIESAKPAYNAGRKVLAKQGNTLVLPLPFYGDASGKIYNMSRLNGAKKKRDECKSRLSHLSPPAPQPQPAPGTAEEEKKEDKMKALKVIGIALLLAALGYGGYKAYQYFSKK